MLLAVLRTNVAKEINVKIYRAFIYMRRYMSTNLIKQKYINNFVLKN